MVPFTKEQKQSLLWFGLGVAFITLLVLLGPILTPFIAGAIFAYAFNPGVDFLQRQTLRIGRWQLSVPRVLAALMIMFFALVIVATLILILVPILAQQVPQLQAQIPHFLELANQKLAPFLKSLGFSLSLNTQGIHDMLAHYWQADNGQLRRFLFESARAGGLTLLGWAGTLLLTPVVIFYLLLDWNQLIDKIRHSIPRRWQKKAVSFTQETNHLLAQYLRGQLSVMALLALYYSLGLSIAGFEVAVPIGILTGLLVFIPYLGFGLGLLLATLSAFLQFDGWSGLISVALVYGIGQMLESFFLTPFMVGDRIGLHPLTVIFALLAFGTLFGFAGVLLALPISAVLSVACKHMRRAYFESDFYQRF